MSAIRKEEKMAIDSSTQRNGGPQRLYQLSGVRKSYGSGGVAVEALKGIDLEIAKGEFVAIIGSSGSGKSTLLQLLGALDRPTTGTVFFEGRDLGRLGDNELAGMRQRTLGFIFQQFNLIPTLNAAENVEVALAPARLPRAERERRALDLLGRVGLGPRA